MSKSVVWLLHMLQVDEEEAYMCSYARVQPACVMVIAHENVVLDHISDVVHSGADFAPDLDLLEGYHHSPNGTLTAGALRKQVPKLHRQRPNLSQTVSTAVW